jgi:hypothetical protein
LRRAILPNHQNQPHPPRTPLRPACRASAIWQYAVSSVSVMHAPVAIQPGRGSLTRHPCTFPRTYLLPLLKIRLQLHSDARLWKNSVSFCLAGRLIIQASSNRLHPTVIEDQSCGPVGSRSSHTLMHSARAKPTVRKYQTSTASPRPCCSFPRRSRQLARHDVEMVLSLLNLQGQSRGSVI